ncbi:MAG: hypothetical protein ACFFBV_13190 [Promethearchaeota archaeon]
MKRASLCLILNDTSSSPIGGLGTEGLLTEWPKQVILMVELFFKG